MIIGYLLLGTGCSDWLSVNPKDKVEQKEMFSDENGFKNALIGNYIMLKDSKLYGKTLTMEFCENLAQHWKTNPQAIDGYTAAYDYKNTESIWNYSYFIFNFCSCCIDWIIYL